MNWQTISEVCFGLVLENRHPVTIYRPENFTAPYDQGIKILLQKGATKEDVAKVVASSYLSDASSAVHKFNGLGEYQNFDWPKALIESQRNFDRARRFKKLVKKWEENEDVDLLPVYGELQSAVAGESSGLSVASDIDYNHYRPFEKSGNPVIDKILGGFPSDGPIIVYGLTGVGKSHFLASTIDYLLHQYPNKKAAIYTLEMSAEHYLWRETNMYPSLKDVMDRLYVSGSVRDIDELVAEVMSGKFDYVGLDDMDNIVKSSDASEYERVYRRVKEVCRFMKIPFFVLCQPNRAAKLDSGNRFLGPYDVAWSGSAENSAALLIALQKTTSVDMKTEMFPTDDDPLYYQIFWKSRDGWPGDYNENGQSGPGSIITKKGKQSWRGDVYVGKYKLWPPGSSNTSIGKKRTKREE